MDVALTVRLMGSLCWGCSKKSLADSIEFKNKQLRQTLQQYHTYDQMTICHICTSLRLSQIWVVHKSTTARSN